MAIQGFKIDSAHKPNNMTTSPSAMDVERRTEQVALEVVSDHSSDGQSDRATPIQKESNQSKVLHTRDSRGNSAAHIAAWFGELHPLRALREVDQELLRAVNSDGFSPMFLADMNGHHQVMWFLELALPEYQELEPIKLPKEQVELQLKVMCETEMRNALSNSAFFSLTPEHLQQGTKPDLMSADEVLKLMDLDGVDSSESLPGSEDMAPMDVNK